MSDGLQIITNNHARLLLYWDELTTREQADFDYLTEDNRPGANFVRYRGSAYDLGEFESAYGRAELRAKGWDGIHCDTYFSGVVVRYVKGDSDRVVMGLALA